QLHQKPELGFQEHMTSEFIAQKLQEWGIKHQTGIAKTGIVATVSGNRPPERWTKVYRDWLVNLRDWCISRQLWWGHQIPAWYAVSQTNGEITDSTPFFVAASAASARAKAVEQFGEDVELQQDPDVLDTWFSSGLWPFSTMGWPDEAAKDFQTYYPTTTLVTGFDIIFFWVARMTMMAGHFTGKMPFETVYIHGLVRDENNQKMSKSKGNGIDPLVLIDKYGTDALRYTLIREVAGAGQDIRLDYNRKTDESSSVEASRNFTNKLWNASRFVIMNLGGKTPADLGEPDVSKLELSDKWILSKFNQTVINTRSYLDKYGMGEAAKVLYEFIWGDFCDWYIELVKPRLYGKDENSKLVAQQTLAVVLDGVLKLLHPFTPHITEEVWHTLTQTDKGGYLAVQPYPIVRPEQIDTDLEKDFNLLIGTIRTIRNLRAAAGVKPSAQIEAILKTDDANEIRILNAAQAYLKDAAKVETLTIEGTRLTAKTLTVAESSGNTAANSTAELPEIDWGDGIEAIQTLLKHPLGYGGQAYSKLKKPASVVLLLLLTALGIRLAAAIVAGLNTVPVAGRFFQMIGVSYTAWFGGRYLLKAANRRQLWENTVGFWDEVAGTLSTDRSAPVYEVEGTRELVDVGDTRQMFAGVFGTVQVLIPLTGLVDIDALKQKLKKSLAKVEGEIKAINARLNNKGFVDKAPAHVVQEARDSLTEAETQAKLLRERLAML
ncbi:MAG: class I tRNA ligase family protein, partial [Symploca sp. SIO2G7]|nr:class I tRNA ligase family protein [Symploca sp. SIO2G7]